MVEWKVLCTSDVSLNALAGPNGEKVAYERLGSCCPFKTKNAVFGDSGMLDKYEITIEGSSKKIILYLNMYDSETLQVPVDSLCGNSNILFYGTLFWF